MKDFNELSAEELKALKKKKEYQLAQQKANEKRRREDNHHKYMMGGVIHKYFPYCYCFEEAEWNRIIKCVFDTKEFRDVVNQICIECGKEIPTGSDGKFIMDVKKDHTRKGSQDERNVAENAEQNEQKVTADVEQNEQKTTADTNQNEKLNNTLGAAIGKWQSGSSQGSQWQNGQGNSNRGDYGQHNGKNGKHGKALQQSHSYNRG